ncbi:MAG: c-type cytochrome [Planctomycetes bacterium]|nr:c-type cytochrome [Planctomycetota bacterium]MCW8135643.1 c-type cytochrome [Planctomycetota bacterium]
MADKKKMGLVKKLVLFTFGGGFLLVVGGYGYVSFAYSSEISKEFDQPVRALEISDSKATIERGKYLVESVLGCGHSECHRADFGGGHVINEAPMGLIYAPNLTPGKGSVTSEYTGEDWARIIRHGIKKNKKRAVIMPSEDYYQFSDADLGAAVSYIKSFPAVDRETPAHDPGFLFRALLATGAIPFAHDKIDHSHKPADVKPGPTVEWGKVMAGTCSGCHGQGFSGGKVPGGDPKWPEARNITPDEATGIGKWKFEDFDKAIRTGERPDGTKLDKVMPYELYKGMSEDDVRALWEYLRTVPAKPAGGR